MIRFSPFKSKELLLRSPYSSKRILETLERRSDAEDQEFPYEIIIPQQRNRFLVKRRLFSAYQVTPALIAELQPKEEGTLVRLKVESAFSSPELLKLLMPMIMVFISIVAFAVVEGQERFWFLISILLPLGPLVANFRNWGSFAGEAIVNTGELIDAVQVKQE